MLLWYSHDGMAVILNKLKWTRHTALINHAVIAWDKGMYTYEQMYIYIHSYTHALIDSWSKNVWLHFLRSCKQCRRIQIIIQKLHRLHQVCVHSCHLLHHWAEWAEGLLAPLAQLCARCAHCLAAMAAETFRNITQWTTWGACINFLPLLPFALTPSTPSLHHLLEGRLLARGSTAAGHTLTLSVVDLFGRLSH